MFYRLLSFDLDGTLLGADGTLSPRTIDALNSAADNGARIVISTGRILQEAVRLTEGIRSIAAIASSNGAYVVEPGRSDALFDKPIDRTAFEELTADLDKSGVFYCFNGPSAIMLRRGVFDELARKQPKVKEELFSDVVLVDDVRTDPESALLPAYKIFAMGRDAHDLDSLRERFSRRDDIELSSSSSRNLEVTARGVDKGNALRVLGEAWGIPEEKMAAFGDGENDIAMFERAGLSIAMGNAVDSVKRAATRITSANHEDGVAEAIARWIL